MVKKTTPETKALKTYTARAEDLKILGYVEAANEKEALKKARKQYDAASVELRDEASPGGEEPPAKAPQSKKKASKAAAKQVDKPESAPQAEPKTADEPEAAAQPAAETAKHANAKVQPSRSRKPKREAKEKKLSALDAAVKVLEEAGQPMTCQELIAAMAAKGFWTSPGGLTPAATLYSAILRKISRKGTESRFQKTERGKFGRAGRA